MEDVRNGPDFGVAAMDKPTFTPGAAYSDMRLQATCLFLPTALWHPAPLLHGVLNMEANRGDATMVVCTHEMPCLTFGRQKKCSGCLSAGTKARMQLSATQQERAKRAEANFAARRAAALAKARAK